MGPQCARCEEDCKPGQELTEQGRFALSPSKFVKDRDAVCGANGVVIIFHYVVCVFTNGNNFVNHSSHVFLHILVTDNIAHIIRLKLSLLGVSIQESLSRGWRDGLVKGE